MGSSGTPFPTSNNAPLPIPGGYGNPTGANTGFGSFGTSSGQPFPSMPSYGWQGGGMSMPSYNVGPWGSGGGIQNLNAGILGGYTGFGKDLYDRLGKYYGRGAGQALGDILSGKLFNPQVAAAFLNAQQPGIARGQANVEGAFGDAGARFSSAAAIGLGDFNSQVQLNQQQMLAQMYENAQNTEVNVLQGLLPTLHAEMANKSGVGHKILGGAEIVGGAILDYYTGGQGGNWLIAKGAKDISGKQQSSSASPNTSGGGSSPWAQPMQMPGYQYPNMGDSNTGTFGGNAPTWGDNSAQMQDMWAQMAQEQNMQQFQADAGGVWSDIPAVTGQ